MAVLFQFVAFTLLQTIVVVIEMLNHTAIFAFTSACGAFRKINNPVMYALFFFYFLF